MGSTFDELERAQKEIWKMEFKRGDKVKVLREGREYEETAGFETVWIDEMDDFVGGEYVVDRHEPDTGVYVVVGDGVGYYFPPQVLELVTNEQSSNPKDKIGRRKPPLHLIPSTAVIEEAEVMRLGSVKYGPYNWREHSVAATVYVDALLRHVYSWLDGEDLDAESGASHLAHARACLGILIDAKALDQLVDDRPSKGRAAELIAQFTKETER